MEQLTISTGPPHRTERHMWCTLLHVNRVLHMLQLESQCVCYLYKCLQWVPLSLSHVREDRTNNKHDNRGWWCPLLNLLRTHTLWVPEKILWRPCKQLITCMIVTNKCALSRHKSVTTTDYEIITYIWTCSVYPRGHYQVGCADKNFAIMSPLQYWHHAVALWWCVCT